MSKGDLNSNQLKVQADTNTKLPCITTGCANVRSGSFSKLCSSCRRWRKASGTADLTMRPLRHRRKPYHEELEQVMELFNRNRTNVGIVACEKYLASWMYQSQTAPTIDTEGAQFIVHIEARSCMRRLADIPIEPRFLLIHACAAFLFVQKPANEYKFKKGNSKQRYIAHAMLNCKTITGEEGFKMLRGEVGAAAFRIWRDLLRIFIMVQSSVNGMLEQRDQLKADLSTPLVQGDQFTHNQQRWLKTNRKFVQKVIDKYKSEDEDSTDNDSTNTNGSTEPGEQS